MLLQTVELLTTKILFLIGYVIVSTITEVGQAWIAYKNGDDTAAQQGWLDANPTSHIDFVSFISILLGFVWVRTIPLKDMANTQVQKWKVGLIYFSQAILALLISFAALLILLGLFGVNAIHSFFTIFVHETISITAFAQANPHVSSWAIVIALLLMTLVFYGVFICAMSIIINGFRYGYAYFFNESDFVQYNFSTWIIGFVLLLFFAAYLNNILFYGVSLSALFIGRAFGIH